MFTYLTTIKNNRTLKCLPFSLLEIANQAGKFHVMADTIDSADSCGSQIIRVLAVCILDSMMFHTSTATDHGGTLRSNVTLSQQVSNAPSPAAIHTLPNDYNTF
jgi:hypothetical protein